MNVYHYTVGHKMLVIARDGFLRPATGALAPGELPVLWFSTNPNFEPTARKGVLYKGRTHLLTVAEMSKMLGLYRCALSINDMRLMHWPRLIKAARIPPVLVERLVDVGRKRGANPNDWWGTLDTVSLDDIKIEAWEERTQTWEDA